MKDVETKGNIFFDSRVSSCCWNDRLILRLVVDSHLSRLFFLFLCAGFPPSFCCSGWHYAKFRPPGFLFHRVRSLLFSRRSRSLHTGHRSPCRRLLVGAPSKCKLQQTTRQQKRKRRLPSKSQTLNTSTNPPDVVSTTTTANHQLTPPTKSKNRGRQWQPLTLLQLFSSLTVNPIQSTSPSLGVARQFPDLQGCV